MPKRNLALVFLIPGVLGACNAFNGASTRDAAREDQAGNQATDVNASPGSASPDGTTTNNGDGTSAGATTGPTDGTPATSPTLPPAEGGNPFIGATQYVRPEFVKQVESSAALAPDSAAQLRKVEAYSTALWLDGLDKVKDLAPLLDGALAEQKKTGTPVVASIVVYDLPDRDCAAATSAGDLTAANGGLAKYKADFIDAIATVLKAHGDQRIVAVLEPGGLPSLATNLAVAKCAAAAPAYREGVAYAISALSMPHTFLYLDAAHSGWLGWNDNRPKAVTVFKDVIAAAGGPAKLRGFATNVANYSPLRVANPDTHPASYYDTNPVHDEGSFVTRFGQDLAAAGLPSKFIVDTSRNGVPSVRTVWSNWCNIVGAGLGERPRAAPSANIDAYVWARAPGESDGVSDPAVPGYDAKCRSVDSALNAPPSREWFHDYFLNLVKNASPAL